MHGTSFSDASSILNSRQETTGCLAFARSLPSTRSLSQQFQDRSASKIYYALVRGGIDSFNGLTQGLIKDHIAYKNGYGQLCAVNEGRESVTEWMLVGSSVSFSSDYALFLLNDFDSRLFLFLWLN